MKYSTSSAVTLPKEILKLGSNVVGLELGVWFGHNMGYLLERCSNISLLYGVDSYTPYKDWNRYIDQSMMENAKNSASEIVSSFGKRAELLITTSEIASTKIKKLDFIFIDGDHSFEQCYKDLNMWYENVRPGGLFSGHDYSLPGVNEAILKFRTERKIKGFFKVIPNDVWYWIKD